ncbi:MAG: 4'-phosphopantetheinyl transferase superfamily protein [Gammaproteobacteria bacterium]|nr:4'-phosphopantetheinyl transferase superfamily protein [Gammaproteobacteria bacterium]
MLEAGIVHLWRAHLSVEGDFADCESVLSEEEMARGKRFIKKTAQIKFILSKAITRKVLSYYLNCSPSEVIFNVGTHGKPFISSTNLQFNVSHSGDYLLIGVTNENAIGVDVEHEKNNKDFMGLAKRFFALAEYEAILKCDDQRAAFYRCWTCKEAFIKATGLGLSFGLSDFEVGATGLLSVSHDGYSASDWALLSVALGIENYFSALAVKGSVDEVTFWDF